MICLCLYGGLHQESMIRTRNPGYWLFWWWWNEKSSLVATTTILAKEEVAPSSASQCRSLVATTASITTVSIKVPNKYTMICLFLHGGLHQECMIRTRRNPGYWLFRWRAGEAGNKKFSTSKQGKANDVACFVAFIAHDESHRTTMHSLDNATIECVINRNRFNCMNNTMGCLLLDNYYWITRSDLSCVVLLLVLVVRLSKYRASFSHLQENLLG